MRQRVSALDSEATLGLRSLALLVFGIEAESAVDVLAEGSAGLLAFGDRVETADLGFELVESTCGFGMLLQPLRAPAGGVLELGALTLELSLTFRQVVSCWLDEPVELRLRGGLGLGMAGGAVAPVAANAAGHVAHVSKRFCLLPVVADGLQRAQSGGETGSGLTRTLPRAKTAIAPSSSASATLGRLALSSAA